MLYYFVLVLDMCRLRSYCCKHLFGYVWLAPAVKPQGGFIQENISRSNTLQLVTPPKRNKLPQLLNGWKWGQNPKPPHRDSCIRSPWKTRGFSPPFFSSSFPQSLTVQCFFFLKVSGRPNRALVRQAHPYCTQPRYSSSDEDQSQCQALACTERGVLTCQQLLLAHAKHPDMPNCW